MITYDEVRKVFNYDEHSGVFSDFNEEVIAVRNKRQKLHKEFVNHG